jgi:uncharacterized protein (TIGR02145 family)
MKNKSRILLNIILGLALLLSFLVSCKKKEDDEEKTVPVAPTAYTDTIAYLSQTWTTLKCIVTPGYLMTTVTFQYDTSTAYTNTVHADPDTISGKTSGNRSVEITGLMPGTKYYYRAVATNSLGTSYGIDRNFTTFPEYTRDFVFNPDLVYGQVTDIQGNVYKTIQIGSQTWMAENLTTKQYNDGTEIPQVSNISKWTALTEGGLSWYENTNTLYGAFYNWYAVNSGKLCPSGWHVPSDEEWGTLVSAVGGTTLAGGNLKETGILHWLSPNTGATNSSGFTGVPGGYRFYSGTFSNAKRYGYWWTSTESSSSNAYIRGLNYSYSYVDKLSFEKRSGASVRCVKD